MNAVCADFGPAPESGSHFEARTSPKILTLNRDFETVPARFGDPTKKLSTHSRIQRPMESGPTSGKGVPS